jgi:SnoaL-like polyketide cyclase
MTARAPGAPPRLRGHLRSRCARRTLGREGAAHGEDLAFSRTRFSGRHTVLFRGFAPTWREVSWAGAALFRFSGGVTAEVWVLGDLAGLDALLGEQAELSPMTDTRPSR